MCGRYTLYADPSVLAELFGLFETPVLGPRYNIAPTQPVAVVRIAETGAGREWALVQWGLVPSWSKDPTIGARMINARAETVAEKPSYRAAFRRRRCIAPADGFFEWARGEKRKQPMYITVREGRPFGIAALWERWVGPDGSEIESCTLLTTEANELLAPIHERMPVILEPEDYGLWLGDGRDALAKEQEALLHLLRPYPAVEMSMVPVSSYVNSAVNEGARCIVPVEMEQ